MEPRAPLPPSAAAPPTLAPPAAAPLATPFPAIVALCEDEGPVREVALAISEQAGMILTATHDHFVDQLIANSAEIALINASIAPNALTSFLADLHRQFPQTRILLWGAAQLHEVLRSQIADGTVLGFAHEPVSAERLKLLLLAALRAGPPESTRSAGGTHDATDAAATPAAAPSAVAAPASPLSAETMSAAASSAEAPPMAPARARPRWFWPLLLCLTTLGAMVVGWYASSFASQRHLLP